MSLPQIVSRADWLVARKALLAKEKEATRARDALNAERRRLPMVEIEKDYSFHGPGGTASLLDLFHGRRQLIVEHVMFDPDWDEGCRSCAGRLDNLGRLDHLHALNTTLVAVSRAPSAKIEPFREKMGWTMPWYSSFDTDFNHDFHVTLDESVVPFEYNYRTREEFAEIGQPVDFEQPFELHGQSVFLRDGERVFHTYSAYARGTESVGGTHYYLDLTALGRQEDWEEPKGRAGGAPKASDDGVRFRDEYDQS